MAAKDTDIVQVDQAVKKTGRGGKYNFPSSVPPEKPEDIRRALTHCLHWWDVGAVKAVTAEEVEQRTTEYFRYCIENNDRPMVESYALALGYDRRTIWKWEQGNDARSDVIKKAKEFISSYDAYMVSDGKLNPVTWIFRAKNYYGMKDQTDITIEPRQTITDADAVQIAEKYSELPG